MKYTAREPDSNVNVTPTSPLREFFLLVGGLLGIAVGIYLLLGLTVDLIAPRISIDFENKMGKIVMMSMERAGGATKEERPVQMLIEGLQGRCVNLPYRFMIHIQKSPAINALALPGGHIMVFSGW